MSQEEKKFYEKQNEMSKYLNTRNDVDPAIKEIYMKPGVGTHLTSKEQNMYLEEFNRNK